MNNSEASALLTGKLGLDIVPVALRFMASPPPGVAAPAAAVPSACAFWRRAEEGLFFAPADAHFNCPVGAMVMGFDLPEAVSAELGELVGRMTQCGYIGADEPGRIPTRPRHGAKGVLYGPLADFPGTPDAVLIWPTPAQAMVLGEATGGACWGGEGRGTVFGRPACAAIPRAEADARATLSLGCVGMRTFTAIPSDRLLVVVPRPVLESFATDVARLSDVNAGMEAFYKDRAAGLAGG